MISCSSKRMSYPSHGSKRLRSHQELNELDAVTQVLHEVRHGLQFAG